MKVRAPWNLLACLAWLLAGSETGGQTARPPEAPVSGIPTAILERPVPIRDGIGTVGERVTTSSARAQAYYNQGLALLHSYVWIGAARSFNEALRLDRNLAMAHLGLSYALGGLGASDGARRALEQARVLAPKVSDRERRRIDARAKQLEAVAQPENTSLQGAYRRALDQALDAHPNDVELLLLRGHAEEAGPESYGMSGGESAIRFYEKALAAAPDHLGAHHYLTHAHENVNHLERALQHGETFARLAPVVPHAHHMYGHELRRVGRITEAIAEFRAAYDLELAYFRAEGIMPEYDWHHHHNLDLLGTSYQYTGRMKSAEQLLRHGFEMPSNGLTQDVNKKGWPVFLRARGRASEALTAANVLARHRAPLVRAVGHIEAGHALMALNRLQQAAEEANRALREMRASGAPAALVVPDFQLLQGEFFLRSAQTEKGREMLRDAVGRLRAQPGPDAWSQALFRIEAVARVARDVADWGLAAELADQLRQHDPAYGGTQYALALVADWRGDRAAAGAAFAEALQRWRDADPDLPELTHARERLAALNVPFPDWSPR